jgi:DNA-binding XRE family transcriptional regulator
MGKKQEEDWLLKIALVLKDLRHEMGVSQEDVYNETNIHIGRIETCKVTPSIITVRSLTKFFNIKMSDFFARVESKK